MKEKFVLIGLPGVGKSTTINECLKLMNSEEINTVPLSTDDIIRNRFKPDDRVIIAFEKTKSIKIPDEVFSSSKPIQTFMQIFGEEPLFRDLEELFVQDILASATKESWFDLGGECSSNCVTPLII